MKVQLTITTHKGVFMKSLTITLALLICNFSFADIGALADVKLSPAGSFVGKTKDVKGFATQKGDSFEASNIVVNLKSLKTGIALRDKHATEKYLEVAKYPDAVLTSASGKGGNGTGKLKIRGIEKDVTGTYKVAGKELTANFTIKLSDYGINGIKYMGVGVNDPVTITVTVPIKN